MGYLKEQLEEVKSRIAEQEVLSGREAGSVKLLAVSKTFPADDIAEVYNAGQRRFGENKVQELELKKPALPDDIEWHLIGHLQSNKVVKAVALADYIHSVDSVKLLKRIDRLAGEQGRCPKILLEVNVSGEESKFGILPSELHEVAELALSCENVQFVGLMTMAPFGADEEILRTVFAGLRKLRDSIETEFNCSLPELSMGMSGDYKTAIAEGATFVRIGTAIFGKRDYSK